MAPTVTRIAGVKRGKGVTVQVKDKKFPGHYQLQALRRALARKPYVRVGVFGKAEGPAVEGDRTPADNVKLALIHEYGAPKAHVPERSYLRSTYDLHLEEYAGLGKELIQGILSGTTSLRKALNLMGLRMVTDVRARIRAGISPGLADSTLARRKKGRGKQFATPLIDTGILINSITYEVHEEGNAGTSKTGGARGHV